VVLGQKVSLATIEFLDRIQSPISISTRTAAIMADPLKAEGNKAFAEKKFEEAMYVTQSFSGLS